METPAVNEPMIAAPRLLIVYHMRLGDIIRCFPIARHFAAQGWQVFIECLPQYHGIFQAISYAVPVAPNTPERAGPSWTRVLDLQIWPTRYKEFRSMAPMDWMEYVYGIAGLSDIPQDIVFDVEPPIDRATYGLEPGFCLLFPFGYSSLENYSLGDTMGAAAGVMPQEHTWMVLDPRQRDDMKPYALPVRRMTAMHLSHLPWLIREAAEVVTVNSAPAVIAQAVRKDFWHIPVAVAQDNVRGPQIKTLSR